MKIDNEFTVGVPVERAWKVLTDLKVIAGGSVYRRLVPLTVVVVIVVAVIVYVIVR